MAKSIKIYGTEQCLYCNVAKEYFTEKKLEFEYFDVGEDEKAREEMIAKTNQMGVPVIFIDDEYIVGFDKEKIEKALK